MVYHWIITVIHMEENVEPIEACKCIAEELVAQLHRHIIIGHHAALGSPRSLRLFHTGEVALEGWPL